MKRILIVDDEPLIRLDIREILEEKGYEIIGEASDGFEAINMCKTHRPDIVIMDIKMPLLDGLTASKKIMLEGTTSGIILLTAYSDHEYVEKAKQYGAFGYLVKPLHEHTLIPMIELTAHRGEEFKQMHKEIDQLNAKLNDRKIIEKAKGKLMALENLSEDEAYKKMRNVSMEKRISMVEIAKTLVLIDD